MARKRRKSVTLALPKQSPVIVDGHHLLMRNLMGTVRDDAKAQTFTGGITGFISYLSAVIRLTPGDKTGPVLVAFDTNPPPIRFELVPNYKDRPRPAIVSEEDMEAAMLQLDDLCDILPLLGITVVAYADREADDVVAAAVQIAAARGETPVAVSGDKDLYQVVAYGGTVARPDKAQRLTWGNFRDEVGVSPDVYAVYKCLVGDPRDAMKGALGIGEVGAQKLVSEYRSQMLMDFKTGKEATPAMQFEILCACITEAESTKAIEAVLADKERLFRELRCLDLSDSFGSKHGLSQRLYEPRECDLQAAYQMLHRWKCRGLLAKWDRLSQSYTKAALLCS